MVNIFRNKEINKLIKEVKKSSQLKHQEEEIEMYYEKLKEEIKDDHYKFIAYKMEIESELNLNFSALWISTLAVIASCIFGIISSNKGSGNLVTGLGILGIVMAFIYYQVTKKARKKLLPIKYVLDIIKEEKRW